MRYTIPPQTELTRISCCKAMFSCWHQHSSLQTFGQHSATVYSALQALSNLTQQDTPKWHAHIAWASCLWQSKYRVQSFTFYALECTPTTWQSAAKSSPLNAKMQLLPCYLYQALILLGCYWYRFLDSMISQ